MRGSVLTVMLGLLAAVAAVGVMKVHEANVASRNVRLERLMQAKTAIQAAGKELTADVADYSSAYSAEVAASSRPNAREESSAIENAQSANERVSNDLQIIARAYGSVYGDATTYRLRSEAGAAHDACARSLEAWARAAGSARYADAASYYTVSKRQDRECGTHGMLLGRELDALGSRLDADLTATQASLSAL